MERLTRLCPGGGAEGCGQSPPGPRGLLPSPAALTHTQGAWIDLRAPALSPCMGSPPKLSAQASKGKARCHPGTILHSWDRAGLAPALPGVTSSPPSVPTPQGKQAQSWWSSHPRSVSLSQGHLFLLKPLPGACPWPATGSEQGTEPSFPHQRGSSGSQAPMTAQKYTIPLHQKVAEVFQITKQTFERLKSLLLSLKCRKRHELC